MENMTDSGQNTYYNCNNLNGSNTDNVINPSPGTNPSNIPSQFGNTQSSLSFDPLNSIQYNVHSNARPKNYTLSEPNFTLQQMYQTTSQPQEYYGTEYQTLANQSPLPIGHNISPSVVAQNQMMGLQQNQPNPYPAIFHPSPENSDKTNRQHTQKPTSPPSSISTHLRNSSSSTKRHSLDQLEFTKPEKPRIATTYWEDEKTICYQVEAQGILVSRREDTSYVNGTKLLNVAGMTRGKRDGILKTEKTKSVVKVGAMNLKGVWIPFERATEIARNEGIDELLYPLFVKDLKSFYHEKGSMLKRDSFLKSRNSEDLANITFPTIELTNSSQEIVVSKQNNPEDSVEPHDFFDAKSPTRRTKIGNDEK